MNGNRHDMHLQCSRIPTAAVAISLSFLFFLGTAVAISQHKVVNETVQKKLL